MLTLSSLHVTLIDWIFGVIVDAGVLSVGDRTLSHADHFDYSKSSLYCA